VAAATVLESLPALHDRLASGIDSSRRMWTRPTRKALARLRRLARLGRYPPELRQAFKRLGVTSELDRRFRQLLGASDGQRWQVAADVLISPRLTGALLASAEGLRTIAANLSSR